jgi:hypothetical protein
MSKPSFEIRLCKDGYIDIKITSGELVLHLTLSDLQARQLAELLSDRFNAWSVKFSTYEAKWDYASDFHIKEICFTKLPSVKLPYDVAYKLSSSIFSAIKYADRWLSESSTKKDWSHIDTEVRRYVEILNKHGIESCQSGDGQTIRFHGNSSEGFRAFAIAKTHGFPVSDLRRVWSDVDGELTGPDWELTFQKG